MKRALKWLGASIALLLVATSLAVTLYLHTPSGYDARLAAITRTAERGAARGHWPGVMWAVVTDGGVLETGAAGFADIAGNLPMTPETIMPIGSITKVLAGLSGSLAFEDGVLDLDAPITEVLSVPFDPPDGAVRSFADLATHTAGILDSDAGYEVVGYHFGDTAHPVSLDQFLTRYLAADGDLYDPANFGDWAPGTRYAYSNIGAGLAGQVIADATGTPCATFTQRRIIDPLGMSGFWGHLGPAPGTNPPQATLYGRTETGDLEPLAL